MAPPTLRLYVLPPSHYCERARWALDHAGLAYTEERWAAGLHVLFARRRAAKSSVPILDTGREILQGSGRILSWAEIAGADPALEQRFETRIGPLVRQYIYSATLRDAPSSIRTVLFDGVSGWQAPLGRLLWPVTRRLMVARMNARPELVPTLERELAAELDWFDARVAKHRYLVGDRFGRADLTAASLLAPLARPAACPIYRRVALPPEVEATVMTWNARPSLQWANRIYADHRH